MFDLEVDPAAGVAAFKRIVQEATGVPPDRQKLLGGKGLWSGILKDDTDLTKVTFMEGSVVSLTGTADVVKAPSAPVRFAEDIAAEESARREQKKPSSYSAYVHLAKKCPEMMSRDWSVRIVLPGPDAMDPSMIMSLVPPMVGCCTSYEYHRSHTNTSRMRSYTILAFLLILCRFFAH